MKKNDAATNPIDAAVGGDADPAGIAQTITTEDIRATLISTRPVEDRLAALEGMKRQLQARANADRGGDITPLIADIDNALNTLRNAEPAVSPESSDIKTY